MAGATTAAAENAVRGGRAVFATVDKPVNMDPADAQLYSSMQVYQNIFHKLVNVDADFEFIPGLASKWTQEDDKTWTLDLVDNAVFHNGEPFTADDVKFSFERLPEHANGIFVNAWKETEVLDPHRVRFHLSQPYGAVLATLAAIGDMVNEKAVTVRRSQAQAGRDGALPDDRVGQGRPHHAGALGQVLQARQAVPGRGRVPRDRRRERPADRPADR